MDTLKAPFRVSRTGSCQESIMEPSGRRNRLQHLRRLLEPFVRPLVHFYWRFSRGATLGARGMVIDEEGRVFLIKHSYVDGWHLPGGGVETGETMLAALRRELFEEGNIHLTAPPRLHGIYFNGHVSRRDHVALFIVRDFRQDTPQPNREIIDHGFFAPDALPPDATRGTRARIAEVLAGSPATEFW
jgi:8-oxo-dGTP pyrophosphatase MutT (NUDIX family)